MKTEKSVFLAGVLVLALAILGFQIASALTYTTPTDVFYNFSFDFAQFQAKSCANPDCSDGSFIGPDNSSSSWFVFPDLNPKNNLILTNLAQNRYFQYLAYFYQDNGQTPRLFNVTITSAPDVLSPDWSASYYRTSESLNCSTKFYGGTGYTVSLRYSLNSNVYQENNFSATNGASISSIVSGGITNPYENWTCSVRVFNSTFSSDWKDTDVRTITTTIFYQIPSSVFYGFNDLVDNSTDFNSGALQMQVRKCTQIDCSDNPSFLGYDNTSSTWFVNSTGNLSALFTSGRFLQYKVYMNTSNQTKPSPEFFNVSVSRNLLDLTSPLVTFAGPTNGTYYNRSSFSFNATPVMDYVDTTQCYLYLNGILNSSNLSIGNNTLASFNLNLSDGSWTWNMNCSDGSLMWNNTAVSSFVVDTHNPNATILNYTNNTYLSNGTGLNFTANLSDNQGLKNATLNIYNSTGLVNQTTTNFASGTVNAVVGVINNLLDGVYNWWWDMFDWTGNQFTTGNRTLTIDTIKPLISFLDSNPSNNSGVSGSFDVNVSIFEINLANVSYNWNGTIIVFNSSNESLTNLGDGNWVFTYTQGNLVTGAIYNYNVSVRDLAGNSNNTETRMVKGNKVPTFPYISYNPTATDDLDPNVNITITVNISDTDNNFDSAKIQWHNQTGSYGDNNISLNLLSHVGLISSMNGSFALPSYESNITFRILANDSTGDYNVSRDYVLPSFWDCTWTDTSDLGAVAGWDTNKYLGGVIINNTGDPQYALANCTLEFRLNYNLPEGRVFYDGESLKNYVIYTVAAKVNQNISINATFGTEVNQENLIITTSETRARSSTASRNTTATLVSNQNGPYLYDKITSRPSEVQLTAGNFSLNGYVRNLMGSSTINENNTAYNVSLYWILPSGLVNVSGSYNVSYDNLTNNDFNYANLNVSFVSLTEMTPGVKTIYLKAQGYTSSGSIISHVGNVTLLTEQVNISFTCVNESDGVYVTACGAADGDYVAPVTTITTPGSGSGGGGGGGAAGAGGTSSRADYQFVRGKTNEIVIPFTNKDQNQSMKGIKFILSGELAKYMEVVPSSLDELGPGQSTNVTIKVTSPGFIKLGQQTIVLEITSGSYDERKSIVLQVNDISKEDAFALIGNATALIEQFKNAGFNYSETDRLIGEMNKAYTDLDYLTVKNDYESLKGIVDSALEAKKIIAELGDLIAQSKEKGIDVSGSERIVKLAELSLNRNDYAEAYARAKEAQTTFALEVKGEIAKLSYYLKNNKKEIGMSAFFLFLFGFAGYKGTQIRLIIMKIKKLKEEERILHGLMKIVQRQTFTEKKMSMEEYGQSMQYYEKRLGNVVEELIELESKRAHALRFTSDEGRLKAERIRIVELIKEIQREYLKEKTIETKSYELRLESYNRRLGMIDEKLATIEAKQAVKGMLR